MSRPRAVISACTVLLLVAVTHAQTAPTSDPTAVSLVTQSLQAVTSGNAVSDVTLTGHALWIAGSTNETGSAKLEFSGTQLSRVDLTFPTVSRSDIRNDTAGFPNGGWIDNAGNYYQLAPDHCWNPAAWFSPSAWLQIALVPGAVVSYVGQEAYNGIAVHHLQAYQAIASQSSYVQNLLQRLTTFDVYLDAASLSPVAVALSTHPEGNSGANIPIVVNFSGYQSVNGVQVPYRIQRFIQGTLNLDISVLSATINSGVPSSDFQLQAVAQ